MDRWEWIRIGGAVSASVAVLGMSALIGNLAIPSEYPARAGYEVPDYNAPRVDLASLQRSWPRGLSEPGGETRLLGYMEDVERGAIKTVSVVPAAMAAPQPKVDLATLLAHSDIAAGKKAAAVCGTCHTMNPGGPNLVGPNLWAVVGRPVGKHGGYTYSGAFAAQTGSWTYERLDHYLLSPARSVPGTKMAFAGIRRDQDRANLVAYLGTLNAKPVPLPKPGS